MFGLPNSSGALAPDRHKCEVDPMEERLDLKLSPCTLKVFFTMALLLSVPLFSAPPVARQEEEHLKAPPPPPSPTLWEEQHLSAAVFPQRETLEERGIHLDLIYTGEGFFNLRGGMRTSGARVYRGDLSLFCDLDTCQAGVWPGGTFHVHLQTEHGEGLSAQYTGDFQVLSNMEAQDFFQLSELYYLQRFLKDTLWIKLGKQDSNLDFAAPRFGSNFLNSSAGYAPTIPLATFPDPDLGAVAGFSPHRALTLKLGCYNGRPKGGRSLRSALQDLRGPMLLFESSLACGGSTLCAGVWWNGDKFEKLKAASTESDTVTESYGWYAVLEREFLKPTSSSPGIGAFGQYGWAPSGRSQANHYVGGGVELRGPLPCRKNDVLGFGVFHVFFSPKAQTEKRCETALEIFYSFEAAGWLSLKPDLQLILNPGGTENPAALAAGVRFQVRF